MRTLLALSLMVWCLADAGAATRRRPTRYRVEATAYSIEGVTKSGLDTRRGLIAADPRFFPLGTEVEVRGIGRYSGHYLVADTGPAIKGREIDIYLPNDKEAKAFGRKRIWLRVLKWGASKP
jgi:3D (Asp-Asp-Asp) domain-containing protein